MPDNPEREPVPYEEPEDLPSEFVARMKENTRAEIFKEMMSPDFKDKVMLGADDNLNAFTKEMKISNITERQLGILAELSVLADDMQGIGAVKSARTLITYRESVLSLSSSLKAMLLKAMNTEYQFKHIDATGLQGRGRRLLRERREDDYAG